MTRELETKFVLKKKKNLYQTCSAEQRAVKQVLCWHQQEWECKIHMGCNEIFTDLVWEGNSCQQGNVKVLKMFSYETGTFVSWRNVAEMFRRLNPQAAPLSPLSSSECHRLLPRAWWRGAAPCHHRAGPGEPSPRSCADGSASWPSRIPKLGAAGSHGCVGGREVSPLRAGFLMTAELQCCVHETFLKSLGCFSAAIAVPATKDGTSLQA